MKDFLRRIPRIVVGIVSVIIGFLLLLIFYMLYVGALDLIGYIFGYVLVISIFIWPIIWIYKTLKR